MKRKLLLVSLIFFVVGACSTPVIAQGLEKQSLSTTGTWLYVGGSGPGNYTKIQDAVNNATNGDTIYVFPGIYKEHIVLPNSIFLQGADPVTTIIDGQSTDTDIVTCIGTDTTISGFTIYNCSMYHSCVFFNHTRNCTLRENIIHTAGHGVMLRKSQNISIVDNMFFQNLTKKAGSAGITVDDCRFISLSKNTISSWGAGMFIHGSFLFISHNTISYNDRGITDTMNSLPQINNHLAIDQNQLDHNRGGIFLSGSTDYSITQNEISNATVVGIYLLEDIYVSVSPENISIKENIITTSAQGIVSENSINLSIEGNSIQRNNLGLSCAYGSRTSVTKNTFQDNNKTVIYYWSLFPCSFVHEKIPYFDRNFWDQNQKAPYPVIGRWSILKPSVLFQPLNILPWVTFDWHPAQEPLMAE